MNLLESCSECYQFALSEYPTVIHINAGLTPAAQFYFKVTDKFQNSYVTEQLTVAGDGSVTIQVLTEGYSATSFMNEPSPAWFNRDAGRFLIEASAETDNWIPVDLTFDTVTYQCITVQFYNDDSEKNTIE